MEQHKEHTAFPDTTARYGLRVYTLGTFGIEWVDPQTGQSISFPPERFQGSRVASCWALFKALLVCPDRFAPRSWLLEQFWPASKNSSATERLNDVASALRILLRPKESKTSLVHFVYGTEKGGAGYRLEGYPQIWCDANAFEWYVKHGMLLDQRGLDSRACWERASALAERGAYLPEHVYEEWAKGRREQLDGLLRDCVQRWTQILRQAGHVDEAILRLRWYWLEHPADEDALRPLLELLGERERFQEAEWCYAKCQAALAEDGHEPDKHTKEAIEVVRALQIRRPSSYNLFKTSIVLSFNESHVLPSSRKVEGEEKSTESFTPELLSEKSSASHAPANDLLRMDVFQQFSQLLGFPSALNTAQLEIFEQQTLVFWQRREALNMPLETFYLQIIDHLLLLKSFLEHPLLPTERLRLCDLTSRMLLLAGVVLYDRGLYPYARQVMQAAAQAAMEAGNVVVQGLIYAWMSFTWTYAGSFSLALPCILEAQSLVDQGAEKNAKAWVAAVQAEIYANLQSRKDCLQALQRAEATLTPSMGEHYYLFGLNEVLLDGYKGVCLQQFYRPDDPETYTYLREAKEALERAVQSETPLRRRRYYLGDLSKIEARRGEIEMACSYASQSLTIPSRIESKSMWQRLIDLQFLLQPYQNEAPVRLLETQIQAQIAGEQM